MADNGWVKIHRKFVGWEWYQTHNMAHLFLYLLLSANHKPKRWQGMNIDRGQLVTGLHSLKRQTGISIQSLRTCIERLKSTNEITVQSTNRYSLITITNYETYQADEEAANKQINKQTNKQATSNQQTTNNKQECKECKKEEEAPTNGHRSPPSLPTSQDKRSAPRVDDLTIPPLPPEMVAAWQAAGKEEQAPNVWLTQAEMESLLEKYPADVLDAALARLSDYSTDPNIGLKTRKPGWKRFREYKDHARALRNFIR